MGAFIAKQPNGLYCRFSSVTDCITNDNMTEDDYVELCAEKARKEARNILQSHLNPFEAVIEYTRFRNISKKEFADWLKSVGYAKEEAE